MWTCEIVSQWRGDGQSDETVFGPVLAALLTLPGEGFEDVTGQPSANLTPDPNVYIVQVRCEAETLDQIEADGRFLVLSEEEEPPDATV